NPTGAIPDDPSEVNANDGARSTERSAVLGGTRSTRAPGFGRRLDWIQRAATARQRSQAYAPVAPRRTGTIGAWRIPTATMIAHVVAAIRTFIRPPDRAAGTRTVSGSSDAGRGGARAPGPPS